MSIDRGALIVLEGLDRSGKSTQHTRLCDHLERGKANGTTDRTTPIGTSIASYLTGSTEVEDHVIHLLFSANRWEAAEHIRKTIAAGETVVVDRYYYSGIAYSAAKQNPTLSLQWARNSDVGLPRPDLTIFLDIDVQNTKERGGFGLERYENERMQDCVRETFMQIIKQEGMGRDSTRIINARASVDDVARTVIEAVDDVWADLELQSPIDSIPPIAF